MHFQRTISKIVSLIALTSYSASCVTTHVGDPVLITQLNSSVSCAYGTDIQTQSISGIVCSLENQSRVWQELKVKSITFPNQKDVTVVSAEDMRILADAYAIKKTREDNNVGLALAGLVLVGALAAAGAHDTATQNVGQAAMLGGASTSVGRDIHQGYAAAQYGPAVYSQDHILNGKIRIPPEMDLRKQIVINHPSDKPNTMEICWQAPIESCSMVSLR